MMAGSCPRIIYEFLAVFESGRNVLVTRITAIGCR